MHSPSRRAFLHGRRLPQSPWEQFCQRLRRTVVGEFVEFTAQGFASSGRLTAQHINDVYHVRALCQQYGVVFALDGVTMPSRPAGKPTVWVRPGSGLQQVKRLEPDGHRWFVQPGCTLAALSKAGAGSFDGAPGHTTVAAWLADRTVSDYATGRTVCSGVEHVRVMLGDGEAITIGSFGHQDAKPLEGMRAQQLVSALFRLAGTSEAKSCLQGSSWPLRYRLDALMAVDGAPVNLAHLLLGHGGDLGWVEWVVINAVSWVPDAQAPACFSTQCVGSDKGMDVQRVLDAQIKKLFDPDGVFSYAGQDL